MVGNRLYSALHRLRSLFYPSQPFSLHFLHFILLLMLFLLLLSLLPFLLLRCHYISLFLLSFPSLYLALCSILGCFTFTVIYFAGLLHCMEKYGFIRMLFNKGNTLYGYVCLFNVCVCVRARVYTWVCMHLYTRLYAHKCVCVCVCTLEFPMYYIII